MATLLIRKLDDELKSRLRMRAAAQGHSMEEEARTILRHALEKPETPTSIADFAYELFGGAGLGVDLEPHPPVVARVPPGLEE